MFGGRASPFFPLGALRVHTKKGCCKAVRFRSSLRELELLFQFDHYAEQRLAVVRHRTGKSPVEILSRRIADTWSQTRPKRKTCTVVIISICEVMLNFSLS